MTSQLQTTGTMLHAEPKPGTHCGRPALPLTIPVVLALAVWGLALWHWTDGSLPPPAPTRAEDSVATELRQFRSLTDREEQVRAITRLGRVRDPRVTVALIEAVQAELDKDWTGSTETPGVLLAASFALCEYHIPKTEGVSGVKYWTGALMWWDTHEAEVRRRAAKMDRSA